MPTRSGIPISGADQASYSPPFGLDQSPWYIGQNHPIDWVDNSGQNMGVSPMSAARGKPQAYSWWMQRAIKGPQTVAQGQPFWRQTRPYDRGAGAYSPKFGILHYSPIGAGIYNPYKLPVIAGPGARYQFGAIWFDVQDIPTSIRINPTVPVETMNALIATSHVGPSYLTTG